MAKAVSTTYCAPLSLAISWRRFFESFLAASLLAEEPMSEHDDGPKCAKCGKPVGPEERASHSVMTRKGAQVFHDVCAEAADARVAFHEKHLMENVVAAARTVDAWLRSQEKGAHAAHLRDALKELDDYRAGKS